MHESRHSSCRSVFVAAVILVCVLLILWMVVTSHQLVGLPAVRRPYSNSSLWLASSPGPSLWTLKPTTEPPKVFLLGKQAERHHTGADAYDIYISIKTTHNNHKSRVPVLILTWLQTVKPEQVHLVTDNLSSDEEVYQAATKLGMNFLSTNCTVSHEPSSLCCKSGEEYLHYYRETSNQTRDRIPYKWFCHFDDDMYANIPNLVSALQRTGNESDDGVYFGRWPGEVVLGRLKNGIKIPEDRLRKVGITDYDKTKLMVKWATGAAYCISASLMSKMEHFFRGHTYWDYCNVIGLNDDLVPAVLAATLGYTITHTPDIKSHYDGLKALSVDRLRHVLTISQHGNNVVNIPSSNFTQKEDPTRFLSYHCLLYPRTGWCTRTS